MSTFSFIWCFQKAQPNGRAVAGPQEEAIVSEEIVPHHQPPPLEAKAEKVAEVIYCTNDIGQHLHHNMVTCPDHPYVSMKMAVFAGFVCKVLRLKAISSEPYYFWHPPQYNAVEKTPRFLTVTLQ